MNIIENLETPYFNRPDEVVQSIIFKDKPRLLNSYHITSEKGDPERISDLLGAEELLLDFEKENQEIREIGKNLVEYDNLQTKAIIDSSVELLKKER